jgi:hypothetical protein
MRLRLSPAAALAVALAAGCSGTAPLPMATSPEKARPAIEAALDAWKAGTTADALRARSPAVHLLDDDFARGRKLVGYKIEGDGKPMGTGLRYDVTLTLQDGAKPPATRKVAYRVVTDPNISISREDF